ncbi:hypothetical protein SDC9_174238 [bioreactor metagenome]|uniref:Uncharacterized protein n=1 Tax=bioreactor metagenome TaxID=1076179 RepID=A0A645GT61_9ZZZZ
MAQDSMSPALVSACGTSAVNAGHSPKLVFISKEVMDGVPRFEVCRRKITVVVAHPGKYGIPYERPSINMAIINSRLIKLRRYPFLRRVKSKNPHILYLPGGVQTDLPRRKEPHLCAACKRHGPRDWLKPSSGRQIRPRKH